MMRRLLPTIAVVALAGCGASAHERAATAPATAPAPAATPDHGRELVYLSRNSWDAVPEDVVVFADGTLNYRMLLHTKINMHVRTRKLPAPALARLRGLLDRTRLAGVNHPGVRAPRGRFTYLLRIDGHSVTTADGHLTPGVKPLITRLDRLADHMLLRGE
jgi:hypothetical protein